MTRKMTVGEYVSYLLKREQLANDTRQDALAAMLADIARALSEHVIETESESRDRFESWVTSRLHSTIDMCRADDGAYCNPFVQEAWEAWQASQQWRAES